MKKLIAISVVFALVAGAAFAVDLGGTVIGTVKVLQGDTGKDAAGDANKVTSDAGLSRVRIDGSGEANENFGGFFRADSGAFYGNAWWKPIDQLKFLLGSNGYDGFIGKEGVTGWGFHQTATDTGVTTSEGGAGIWNDDIYGYGIKYRHAFFEGGGDGGNAAYLFITPMDMLGINVIIPFFGQKETADAFKKAVVQIDFKMEGVGNIALTYVGGLGNKDATDPVVLKGDDVPAVPGAGKWKVDPDTGALTWEADAGSTGKYYLFSDGAAVSDPASIFVYYGGSFGDLSIDFGLGYTMASKQGDETVAAPIGIGLGVKYAMETLGVKFRSVVDLPMHKSQNMKVLAEVLPYFVLGDNLAAYVGIGLGMLMPSANQKDIGGDAAKSYTGWQFNPYLVVGEEWGAKFLVGVKAWSDGMKHGDSTVTNWAVPVALIVSF